MKINKQLDRKVPLAFGSAIAILLVVGAFSYHSIVGSSKSDLLIRHTHEVLENLQALVSGMETVSASVLGFVLTEKEAHVETYRAAKLSTQQHAEVVRNLTKDNPAQQGRLAALEKLAAVRFQRAEMVIGLRRSQGLEAAADAVRSGPGQQIADELQVAARQLQDEELRLLEQRNVNAAQSLSQTKAILIFGTVLGLLITVAAGWSVQRDSIRRRLAENALRYSGEQFRLLLDGIQDYAIFMMDPKGQIISWNTGAERIKGYSAGEIVGRNYSCFFPPRDVERGRPEEILRMTAASGEHEEQGMRVRKDGSQFLASATLTALRDRVGNLRGFSEFSHDLSVRNEAGAKYRGLLEAAPDAMVVVNQGGEIVLLNVQAEKQFGYRRDELLGQRVTNIIPEGFAERLVADDLRSAEDALAQQIGTGIELIARRKDGSAFPIEIMLSPLVSAEGTLVTAAIRDISVRKAAEAHLGQMESRYRGLLEAAPDAMVVVNQGGEIVLLNVQAEKQFGYRRDELLGQRVTNIIPEGFAERLVADDLRSAEDALAQQIGTGIELIARRKDGSAFPIEIMLSPLVSAEGTLVTAAIRDISVRKAAEAHLGQMEGRYRGLLEAAPDAMVVVNQGGEIVLLNVQAEKQFGYRRDELLGQRVTNIIPEGFAERLVADDLRSAEDALAQQIGTGIELIARRKDGSAFPIEIMLSPLVSAEGTLVTAAIRDISVRKAAEAHLGQMEGRYRGLLEAAPDAMVVVNQGGEIVLLNVQAEKQFGYRRDELLGQRVTNIIPEGFAERLVADDLRSAEDALAQQIGTGIELIARRKDGSAFPIEIMLSPLVSAEGTLVTAAIRDISVRKAAEAHLGQMEGRYRGLLEAAPDAMVVVNQGGEIVLLNVQAEKQFGYRRDELLGQRVTNIIPEGFAERLVADDLRSAEDALAQQIGTGIELIARRKDGSAFPIEIMLSPLVSAEGTLVTAAIRDISVRKAAEAHLGQMEGRYRGLLEAAPDAMVVVNQGGEIVLLNVQAEKQFGYRRDELLGQRVTNIIPEGFAERLVADDLRSAEDALAQQIGTGIELIARRKDGSAFPIEIMLSPLVSAEGTLVTAAIRDISVRKAAEAHLGQMEGRYRGLLEAAPDAMVVVNQGGEIVLLNVQAEKQFGYRRDELLGQRVTNIIPEGFAERLVADDLRSAEDALAQQIGTGIELIARRKDGSAFPIEIMLSPLVSAEGTLVTAAIRDISVRKAAEAHLGQMEGRYRGLLEAAPDAMVVVNQGGEIVLLNVQAEKQFGYRRDELLGQRVTNIIPEGFAERLVADDLRSAEDALAQQIGTGIELIARRKDGSAFPIEIMLSPLVSAEGTLVTAAIRDISVRKAAEAHLGQMEGRYRGLLEAAPDAMVVVNQGGEIVLLNVQAEKQFGYRRDELLGQRVTNIIPEGFAERLVADDLRSAEDALAQQIGTGIELIARRKDGSAFPIEIMLSPLVSAEGTLVTAAIRDISVRKAAEAHLGQMEGRYRGLLEAAPDAMVVVNQGGEIVLLNVQAEKQFGYRRDELLGQRVTNIIPEGFAERLVADGLRSAEDALAQQIGTGIELIARRKDGSKFPIEIMLSPLVSAEGTLVTAAIRDITARKAAEANLLHKVGELNRSNEELGQFALIASHDLQEPLRMVASYTQLLSKRYKGKLDADADEFISYAVDGAGRMQRLIQDLLAYSRVGSKGKNLRDTSSEDALQQAIVNLRGAIGESGALVTHDPLPTVLADETQLTQLFQNLVGNAIKYQSPGVPRVHIAAARNGGAKWLFSVQDNGLGIDPQYFEKIFGMFQRLHKREEFTGTGIGLAICKKIVERHGGTISVESQPGHGSTFRFALAESEGKS